MDANSNLFGTVVNKNWLAVYLTHARHIAHSHTRDDANTAILSHVLQVAWREGWDIVRDYLISTIPSDVRQAEQWALNMVLTQPHLFEPCVGPLELGAPEHCFWAVLLKPDHCTTVLRGADLRGVDLRWADLSNADLCEADLTGADLRWSNLRGIGLVRANLTDASLCGADLRGAYLDGACLRRADLSRAICSRAVFEGANMEGSNLCEAHLVAAQLNLACLVRANLTHAELWRATLISANLQEAELQGAQLQRVDLSHTTLTGATFEGTTHNHTLWPDGFDPDAHGAVEVHKPRRSRWRFHRTMKEKHGSRRRPAMFQPIQLHDGLGYVDEILMEDIELSIRTQTCLQQKGLRTLADLLRCSPSELLQIRNFGRRNLNEVNHMLNAWGLALGEAQKECDPWPPSCPIGG